MSKNMEYYITDEDFIIIRISKKTSIERGSI